jgi:hypothetical protein
MGTNNNKIQVGFNNKALQSQINKPNRLEKLSSDYKINKAAKEKYGKVTVKI